MDTLFTVKVSYLIPLLPLIGACVSGFFGARWLKQQSHWPIWIGVGCSAILSFMLLFGMFAKWGTGQELRIGQETEAREGAREATTQKTAEVGEENRTLSTTSIWYTWGSFGDPKDPAPNPNQYPTYLHVDAGAFFDPLTAVMLCVVTGIGFFITVFAAGYMKGEEGYFRFFAYLGLFIFAMTILVMGENLIMLYLGWEGVGLCSYLLIGYYYERPAAREAAKKAFIVNRVGDFGFGIGIMICFLLFGTVSFFGDGATTFTGVLTKAADPNFVMKLDSWHQTFLYWLPFCLMLGAFGKSAQFPLYVWLPDAMEGPTPVSALIHAATMVTAGVYMIARCATLFYGNHDATMTVAIVGCFTALFAATIALRQFDLKKVFAYSTVSQLGFMFVGVGVLAPVAGVFHLVTHAFFKALLFLSSGVVMHAMAGELDMRKFSGLKKALPKTRWLMLIGCCALAGIPGFSGFFSKDEIVGAARHEYFIIGLILLFTAFLTAYYTFRLYFRVFEGPLVVPEAPAPAHGSGHGSHEDTANNHAHGHGNHDHEPSLMIVPLIVLAVGAVLAGLFNFPERVHSLGGFLGQSPSFVLGYNVAHDAAMRAGDTVPAAHFGIEKTGEPHESALFDLAMGTLIAGLGFGLAALMHWKDRSLADRVARAIPGTTSLIENKYYVDEIYQAYVVEPLRFLGDIFFAIDTYIVDVLVNLMGWIPQLSGFALKLTVQRGYLQGYATTMLFGVMIILVLIFLY
jgi:NADH-quinone oxidoreductase subunit L